MRLSIVTTLSFLGVFACGSSAFNSSMSDAGPAPQDGGAGGDAAVPPPPPNCDVSKLPTEDPCVVHEGVGVFVSALSGSAQGDGSRARPLASLQAGIDLAKQSGRRVYVCAETYEEQLTLADGVSVFGYFDCAMGWSVGAKRAIVAPTASPATRASGLRKPTRLEALAILASDAKAPSGSSVALLAASSPGLTLVGSRLHAGAGAAGAVGADVTVTDSGSGKSGGKANGDYTCNPQGLGCSVGPFSTGGSNTCTGGGQSIMAGAGGSGGAPGNYESDFLNGLNYAWVQKTNATNPGGAWGTDGSHGTSGSPGGDVGRFDASAVYIAADGSAGTSGSPGTGGQGGNGYLTTASEDPSTHPAWIHWGIAGGAGGAGGCPGFAAMPGKGGGASVGLLTFANAIVVVKTLIDASQGGAGGQAGMPSAPLVGGAGGAAKGSAAAGANGGNGGAAGASGSGGGGPSFAVAYSGEKPNLDQEVTLQPGNGGDGAPARSQGPYTILASPSGKSAATYSF